MNNTVNTNKFCYRTPDCGSIKNPLSFKGKKQTNMRSATSEITQKLSPAVKPTLEEMLDLIANDELLEVTPLNLRLRKRTLLADRRHRESRDRAKPLIAH